MVQQQSRCDDHILVVDIINAAGMDETYGTSVDDECVVIHVYDDDTNDDADGDADDGGRGDLCTIAYSETLILDLVRP